MGRPLNSNHFGDDTGKILCDAWLTGIGSSSDCHILEQRSNTKYRVAQEATTARDALDIGSIYVIVTVSGSDFVSVGAASNTVGVRFTATGTDAGGTGTAREQQVCKLVLGEPLAAGEMQVEVTPELLDTADEMEVDFGTNDLETLINGQDETSYDGAPVTEGSFTAGDTGYAGTDELTMSDGSVVTVDLAGGGTITEFTVDSSSATPLAAGENRTQVSSTSGTGTGFILTPLEDNEVQQSAVNSVTLVLAGSGYFTSGTFTIGTSSDASFVAGTEAVIAYTVANQVVTSVAVQSGGAGYTNSLAATTDVNTADLPDPEAAGSEQSARIINARTVKTFEGNTYMWPAEGITGSTKIRPEADLGTQS